MQCLPLIKLPWFTVAILLFCTFVPCLRAQTSDAQASDAQASESQSWTKTTESHTTNMNPTRTTESHQKSAKGTVDKQTVERLGADGHYEPYYDIEKESVQVNGTTTRMIERTFARDASGQKILTLVTEEEKQSLPAGGEKVVRTRSNADLDGHLQVAQREVTNTRKVNPEVQEKNTTVFLSDGQGGMAPSMQIQQREKRSADHMVELQTSTLLPDGSGNCDAGLQVTTKTLDTVQVSPSGAQETSTIEARDVSGSFTVGSFDTQRSDNVHAIDVDIAPQNQPK